MKSMMDLKCPRCGANLSVEKDRDILFCQYCGAKIILTDENTYTVNKNITINQTIHHIDDAKITRAETERMVQMHQMEMDKKKSSNKTTVIILKIVFSIFLGLLGLVLMAAENILCLMCIAGILLIWINDISPSN